MPHSISINRAPVLTLWGAVVAARMGFAWEEALTLGRAVAGLNAQAKGQRLGIFKPPEMEPGKPKKKHGLGEEFWVEVVGRPVPAKNTERGVRAVVGDQPIDPTAVEKYLLGRFGDDYEAAKGAMEALAASHKPTDLASSAYSLYERFRPKIESGRRGWGQKGTLDLALVRSLARP